MITWVSALVFAGVLVVMWVWVARERRHSHVKKRER
jgi:hypothetical protein